MGTIRGSGQRRIVAVSRIAAAVAVCGYLASQATACTDGGTPGAATTAAVAMTATRQSLSDEGQGSPAVYLSLGDSIQYGCCHDPKRSSGELFHQYLSQRLNRSVEWVTLAGNDTADEFINGLRGQTPQLDRAVAALEGWRDEGRPVVAITLSIGGNDLVEMGRKCHEQGKESCPELYGAALRRYMQELPLILQRLNDAKDPHTPLSLLTYYNASDCGQPDVQSSPTELGVQGWNSVITAAGLASGAFLADAYTPFRGKACEYVEGVDPTYEGHAVIAQVYEGVYESLPPEFVEPFDRSVESPASPEPTSATTPSTPPPTSPPEPTSEPDDDGSGAGPPHVEPPPPATLVAASGEQISGVYNYCWKGLCVDMLGVMVPKEALIARADETLTFKLAIEPTQLVLLAWTLDKGSIVREYEGFFAWRGQGETDLRYELPAQSSFQFTPDFLPGRYVIVLDVHASDGGVGYAFLLDLAP